MNKMLTSAIAGAAGVALVLGGAGTFALWSSTATVEAGSISTGTLALTATDAGAWEDGITEFVPGDSDTYTQNFEITAAGDNLEATLDAAYTAVSDQGVTADASVVVKDSTGTVVAPAAGVYTFTGSGTYTVAVSVDVSFDADNTDNQGVSVPLGDVTVSLKQVAA